MIGLSRNILLVDYGLIDAATNNLENTAPEGVSDYVETIAAADVHAHPIHLGRVDDEYADPEFNTYNVIVLPSQSRIRSLYEAYSAETDTHENKVSFTTL